MSASQLNISEFAPRNYPVLQSSNVRNQATDRLALISNDLSALQQLSAEKIAINQKIETLRSRKFDVPDFTTDVMKHESAAVEALPSRKYSREGLVAEYRRRAALIEQLPNVPGSLLRESLAGILREEFVPHLETMNRDFENIAKLNAEYNPVQAEMARLSARVQRSFSEYSDFSKRSFQRLEPNDREEVEKAAKAVDQQQFALYRSDKEACAVKHLADVTPDVAKIQKSFRQNRYRKAIQGALKSRNERGEELRWAMNPEEVRRVLAEGPVSKKAHDHVISMCAFLGQADMLKALIRTPEQRGLAISKLLIYGKYQIAIELAKSGDVPEAMKKDIIDSAAYRGQTDLLKALIRTPEQRLLAIQIAIRYGKWAMAIDLLNSGDVQDAERVRKKIISSVVYDDRIDLLNGDLIRTPEDRDIAYQCARAYNKPAIAAELLRQGHVPYKDRIDTLKGFIILAALLALAALTISWQD